MFKIAQRFIRNSKIIIFEIYRALLFSDEKNLKLNKVTTIIYCSKYNNKILLKIAQKFIGNSKIIIFKIYQALIIQRKI